MVTSTIEEMTSEWKERILMSSFEVGASFLDGTLKVDFNSMPTHLHLGKLGSCGGGFAPPLHQLKKKVVNLLRLVWNLVQF